MRFDAAMSGGVAGNRLVLLEAGREFFPALEAALDAAKREIFLETYIFADDAVGQAVANALRRAAGRGVAVHLLVDGFGSMDFDPALGAPLAASGVRWLVHRRLSLPPAIRRLHRKVAVVDGQVAFVGGINIVADAAPRGAAPGTPCFDFALQVEGLLAGVIRDNAARLWNRSCWRHLRRTWRASKAPAPAAQAGATEAVFLFRDSFRHRRDIEKSYLAAIAAAKEEILLSSAYFLPGRRFRQTLAEAAGRGVRVAILLQGRPDLWLAHHASEALRGSLLAAGVRLYAYTGGGLHAKVAVVDGAFATVGSSNIDPLSLLLAREANVATTDRPLAAALRARLDAAMREDAEEITLDDWRRRSLAARAARWLAYGLIRLLFGLAGYWKGF